MVNIMNKLALLTVFATTMALASKSGGSKDMKKQIDNTKGASAAKNWDSGSSKGSSNPQKLSEKAKKLGEKMAQNSQDRYQDSDF